MYMISNNEAREAAIKLKQYCNMKPGCKDCCFAMIDGGCLIGENTPSNWYLEAEAPSDMERRFAKRMLNDGFDYVNIDYDMDGRHATLLGPKHQIGVMLHADSFHCLLDAGNYSLQSIMNGKAQRRKPNHDSTRTYP